MEHARRLTGIWSYLPTFRFVAEEQHVGRAAKMLGLNPSSVSRAISDLEAALGYRVFDRRGRALALNASGQRLLEVVRIAMRRVDDGITKDTSLGGRVRIAADEPFLTASLSEIVARLRRDHPAVVPVVGRAESAGLDKQLLTGAVDVGFGLHRAAKGLSSTKLCELETGLYVGADHPITRAEGGDRAELEVVEIRGMPSASALAPLGLCPRIVVVTDDAVSALGIARATGVAALLPDRLVQVLGGGGLVRVRAATPSIPVHVLSREELGGTPQIRAVVLCAMEVCEG